MAYDTTTTVTDNVSDNLASYHNQLKAAADHAMSASAYAAYTHTHSMTGNVTLTDADLPIQSFDPTAARDLTLPAVATTNHSFYVINRSATYAITIKNAAAATIATLSVNSSLMVTSDGANGWYATGITSSSTDTFTNKRITKRVSTEASNATPAIAADSYDIHTITALAAAATFGAPTGTPTQGQQIIYRIKDNGTARALSWNAIYRAMGTALPTTTVLSKTLYLGFIYNSTDSKWDLIASAQEA
jgi:hypothetical protein